MVIRGFAARRSVTLVVCGVLVTFGLATAGAVDAVAATVPAPISLTSSSCSADIEDGQISGCVTELQDLLNVHGAGLSVDGAFGPGTLAAVKSFQTSHSLTVDGIVGPATKAALLQSAAPAAISLTSAKCPTDIGAGEIDGCVTELQELLNSHGAALAVDGDFGPGTLAAVESFQSGHGLTADGIVGPNTKAALSGGSSTVPSPIALTSASCPADIVDGQTSGCVTELQERLNIHGAALSVDGDFGAATLAAVESFQASHGLAVDGIVGPNTKQALDAEGGTVPAAISLTSSSCPTDIEQGQISGCVTELQELLNSHGADLSVDGDFGPATLSAVESYQAGHGLSVDGIVGPDTKASLTGSTPPGNTPPPPSSSTMAAIVKYATAIEAGDAETGWKGGKIPYEWDGGHAASPGPSPGDCAAGGGDQQCWIATQNGTIGGNGGIGLDCSGFARWVYSLAYGRDVLGPDGTGAQISEMTRVTTPTPGDLAFFNDSDGNLDHVGIYIGGGNMINAYDTGTYVETNTVAQGGTLVGYYQYGSGTTSTGQSTNFDWANTVLKDGGWPQSSNNVATITQWMSGEEPASDWWNNINPLNNGLGSGGGSGLGSYPNLVVAADYAAQNLQGSSYATVKSDLASSAAPATTATAIWDSPWACGHYSGSVGCNTDQAEWGAAWHHGSVTSYVAPPADW